MVCAWAGRANLAKAKRYQHALEDIGTAVIKSARASRSSSRRRVSERVAPVPEHVLDQELAAVAEMGAEPETAQPL